MRQHKKFKNIIYVNYSPYENSGKILDYLLENFSFVFLISLGFYYLGTKQKSNSLTVYKKGKILKKYPFYQLPIPSRLVFIFLPIKSIINLIQITFWNLILYRRYGRIDYYFSVNAYTAWIGNLLRACGLVHKTIFWVWDYYPPIHSNKIITMMRLVYWQFDKISSFSDRVVFVNRKLIDLRKDLGVLPKEAQYQIVPIGTERLEAYHGNRQKRIVFGFIGVLKKSHGLDVIFDHADKIIAHYPRARLEVIGSGPDEDYFAARARTSPLPTTFHGFLDEESVNDVLQQCTIGIATYLPDKSNVSHYGDPGKIKRYLSHGMPVITTHVLEFSQGVSDAQAGIIVDYVDPQDFVKAVDSIMSRYDRYSRNALKLSNKYYYRDIYPAMFNR